MRSGSAGSALFVCALLFLGPLAPACKRKEHVAPAPVVDLPPEAPIPVAAPLANVVPPIASDHEAGVAKPTFAVGDKIKINWKGTCYPGVVLKVVAKDQYKIHYDGYEDSWDEVIGPSRILGRR